MTLTNEPKPRGSHRRYSPRGVARPPGGWSIWLRENGVDRHFYVAIPFEAEAIGATMLAAPKAEFVSIEQMSQADLISVRVPPGEVVERVARSAMLPA